MATIVIKGVTVDTKNLEATTPQAGQTGESRGWLIPYESDLYNELLPHVAQPEWALGIGNELLSEKGEVIGRVTGQKFSDKGEVVAIMTNFNVIARPNSARGLIVYADVQPYKISKATPGLSGVTSLTAIKALREQLNLAIDGLAKSYNANAAVGKLLSKSVQEVEDAIKAGAASLV